MCTQATGPDTEAAKIAPLSLQNHSNLGKIGDFASWLQYQNCSGAHWFSLLSQSECRSKADMEFMLYKGHTFS